MYIHVCILCLLKHFGTFFLNEFKETDVHCMVSVDLIHVGLFVALLKVNDKLTVKKVASPIIK